MISFSNLFNANKGLEFLTMATCIVGGTLWLSRGVKILRDDFKSKGDDSSSNLVVFFDSLSIRITLSALYSYLALNVNNFLISSSFCTIEALAIGYASVLVGVGIEVSAKPINSLWRKLFPTDVDTTDKKG